MTERIGLSRLFIGYFTLLFSSLRIFGHPIDEKNPAEIGEVGGEENGDGKMSKVNISSLKPVSITCPIVYG